MWFKGRPDPEVPANKEVPPLRTWIISGGGGVRESVHAHGMRRTGDDMAFFRYTGGFWVSGHTRDFPSVPPYWTWKRREVFQVANYTSIKELDNS